MRILHTRKTRQSAVTAVRAGEIGARRFYLGTRRTTEAGSGCMIRKNSETQSVEEKIISVREKEELGGGEWKLARERNVGR